MQTDNVKFAVPPVQEVALSLQFAKLAGYTSAHAGWFWREYLIKTSSRETWPNLVETQPIPEQFEKFGEDEVSLQPGLRVFASPQPLRAQFMRGDKERIIQVQDDHFVLNWRKHTSPYPGFDVLLVEFQRNVDQFASFISEVGFGPLQLNQWEITYVNQSPKGDLWQSTRDWSRLIPNLYIPPVPEDICPPSPNERISGDWRFNLPNQRGRIYIQIRQAQIAPSTDEFMYLTLIGRGPLKKDQSLTECFTVGHNALLNVFLSMTSKGIQDRWGRKS